MMSDLLDGYSLGHSGGKYYKAIASPALNHDDADAACRADGALLAMSKTNGDAQDMKQLIGEQPHL